MPGARNTAERACSGADGKTIRKRWRNHEVYVCKSIVFLPGDTRDPLATKQGKRGGGGAKGPRAKRGPVGSRPFASVKSAQSPRPPGIFPDFQFICRHKARTGHGQWGNAKRSRNANVGIVVANRIRGPVPCWPSDTRAPNTLFIEF